MRGEITDALEFIIFPLQQNELFIHILKYYRDYERKPEITKVVKHRWGIEWKMLII